MQGNDVLIAVLPVVHTLERLGVPYYVGGSLASSAHGVVRATVDADHAGFAFSAVGACGRQNKERPIMTALGDPLRVSLAEKVDACY